MTLNFILDGQTLSKGKGFPKVVEKSANFINIEVAGVPDGYATTAYFELSWEAGNVYDKAMVDGKCVIDEYITTLPEEKNEYVDYVVSISIAGTNKEGTRFTTNKIDLVIDETTYTDETENTPDIPQSQYQQYIADIAAYSANPPKIGENGNWYTWNGVEYEDTGVLSNNTEVLGDISAALDIIISMQEYLIGGDA